MTFSEYYKYYLTLHRNKWNRRLHAIGQISTVLFVMITFYFHVYPLLLLTPFIVYPFAWTGHFVFEKNTPAAFSRPIWAKACDWIMLKDMVIGRISA
jgi:hypothetical protein